MYKMNIVISLFNLYLNITGIIIQNQGDNYHMQKLTKYLFFTDKSTNRPYMLKNFAPKNNDFQKYFEKSQR